MFSFQKGKRLVSSAPASSLWSNESNQNGSKTGSHLPSLQKNVWFWLLSKQLPKKEALWRKTNIFFPWIASPLTS